MPRTGASKSRQIQDPAAMTHLVAWRRASGCASRSGGTLREDFCGLAPGSRKRRRRIRPCYPVYVLALGYEDLNDHALGEKSGLVFDEFSRCLVNVQGSVGIDRLGLPPDVEMGSVNPIGGLVAIEPIPRRAVPQFARSQRREVRCSVGNGL